MPTWEIDPEVAHASTLPASFYRDATALERLRERVFSRSWHFVGDAAGLEAPGSVRASLLLEGCVDEPVLLARGDGGELRCLSNVCTHRGAILCAAEGRTRELRCRYHGRRFALDGRFLSMPEFEGAVGFPRPEDDLPRLALGRLGPLLFAAIDPARGFDELIESVRARVGFLDLDALRFDPAASREFSVAAHFALYCDNYLEGFHVPFVHPTLNRQLDYRRYRTELFDHGVLQVGVAEEGADGFEPPPGHVDHGTRIAAYYFWLWPNLMLNFYPWGLSLNVVVPLDTERTRVRFFAWVLDGARRAAGAGAELDAVEREDEEVVESVQRGLRSRLYTRGRFSPQREQGVHLFQRLLAAAVAD